MFLHFFLAHFFFKNFLKQKVFVAVSVQKNITEDN